MHMWYYFNATLWKLLIALVCSFACHLLIIRQCHVELNGYPSDFQYVYVTSQCPPYGVAPFHWHYEWLCTGFLLLLMAFSFFQFPFIG